MHTNRAGKLTRVYTQNIDGLEFQTSLPREKVVNVHGSTGAAACEVCGKDVDFGDFCAKGSVRTSRTSPEKTRRRPRNPPRSIMRGVRRPDGRARHRPLPRAHAEGVPRPHAARDLPDCDLLIVMGTSLTVAPAYGLAHRVPPTALRTVANNEKVGRRLGIDYGERSVRGTRSRAGARTRRAWRWRSGWGGWTTWRGSRTIFPRYRRGCCGIGSLGRGRRKAMRRKGASDSVTGAL